MDVVLSSDVLPPPKDIGEIDGRPDAAEWWEAARSEYEGKVANKTFKLVPRPEGKLVCKTNLRMTNKLNADGTLEARKVRWYLCGYSQLPGIHFDKTYTATAKSASIRIFF
eukprot:12784822-Prorocentrum_lima.AAC.1